MADQRFVAAALIPGQVLQPVDIRIKRIIERARLYEDASDHEDKQGLIDGDNINNKANKKIENKEK